MQYASFKSTNPLLLNKRGPLTPEEILITNNRVVQLDPVVTTEIKMQQHLFGIAEV